MNAQRPKLIFFGTPEIAVPALQALADSGSYTICGVVTQTDKPAGRGKQLAASPVKLLAEKLGIPVLQPKTLKGLRGGVTFDTENEVGRETQQSLIDLINTLGPIDAFIVVAYGKLIPQALIDVPKMGIINIHLSLLPRWRGAAPIQRAVLAGDLESGISLMKIDAGLDTGPVYAQERIAITPDDTTGSLSEKLVASGCHLLLNALPNILSGDLDAIAQPEFGATYAEKLSKADFQIAWSKDTTTTLNQIRGAAPHPGASTLLFGEALKIYRAHRVDSKQYSPGEAGTVLESNREQLIVATDDGALAIDEMQFPGKKRLPISDVLRGRAIPKGSRFGSG